MVKLMNHPATSLTKLLSIGAFALLAGCAQQNAAPVAEATPYNPPGTALSALPANNVTWYHASFDSGSARIGSDAQSAVNGAAEKMRANPTMTATVIGKTDGVGSDASNMRLSQQRANAVRDALVRTGNIRPGRIETRWTGERQPSMQALVSADSPGGRIVDIGVH
jgi:outer membrane protein OmpA-like peptidoglycan-associated protein